MRGDRGLHRRDQAGIGGPRQPVGEHEIDVLTAQIPTVNRYQQGKALGLLKEAEAAVVGAVVL